MFGGKSANADIYEHREEAWLAFSDGTQLFGYHAILGILPWNAGMQRVPSLLGRDIIHRWSMDYRFGSGVLEFTVDSADVVVAAPGPLPAPGFRHD